MKLIYFLLTNESSKSLYFNIILIISKNFFTSLVANTTINLQDDRESQSRKLHLQVVNTFTRKSQKIEDARR